jgi:hypothetical protein
MTIAKTVNTRTPPFIIFFLSVLYAHLPFHVPEKAGNPAAFKTATSVGVMHL